jgi:hypothetical protein
MCTVLEKRSVVTASIAAAAARVRNVVCITQHHAVAGEIRVHEVSDEIDLGVAGIREDGHVKINLLGEGGMQTPASKPRAATLGFLQFTTHSTMRLVITMVAREYHSHHLLPSGTVRGGNVLHASCACN